MINSSEYRMFRSAQILGYAGLFPQILAVALFTTGGEWKWIALAAGFAYPALIFSFLGGVWWGQGITIQNPPRWVFLAAVLPSLIALALFIPWTLGWAWPEPSLFWLGLLLMGSPWVDARLGMGDAAWMRLRWHLSFGLGGMTTLLGVLGMVARP